MPQSILVIDDSPAIHALLNARLKEEPVSLAFANCGDIGMKMAAAVLPDLILLDVDMPNPDGFEVCRRLKADQSLRSTPIILMTGAASTEEKIRGLELGAVDYITKPFDPAELRARVRMALRMKFMMDLLASKAQIDAVTGLWNCRYFDQRYDAEVSLSKRSGRPLAVVILELDQFKSINEDLGQPAGDEMLRQVATRLVDNLRAEDIVCRYDGAKFAVIASNISATAATLAQRLCSTIGETSFRLGGHNVSQTASLGVAFTGEHPVAFTLVENADDALRRARESGGNRIEVAAAMVCCSDGSAPLPQS